MSCWLRLLQSIASTTAGSLANIIEVCRDTRGCCGLQHCFRFQPQGTRANSGVARAGVHPLGSRTAAGVCVVAVDSCKHYEVVGSREDSKE